MIDRTLGRMDREVIEGALIAHGLDGVISPDIALAISRNIDLALNPEQRLRLVPSTPGTPTDRDDLAWVSEVLEQYGYEGVIPEADMLAMHRELVKRL